MTRILLLGGTGDALQIARTLRASDVYSLAGIGKVPVDLACAVRVGGFGGAHGLHTYLVNERIGLLIDATHPFAARISANAASACRDAQVRYWALRRAPWQPQAGDDWHMVDNWPQIVSALTRYRRPLFTLGREPLGHLDEIPSDQYWVVRCLESHAGNARASVIGARGPFTIDGERALFASYDIDVIVTKNSGGSATAAKLDVARERGLPVVMTRRPELPPADREFDSPAALLQTLRELAPHR
ncbi:cobalt-precorrin-6A reductase [Paraburkholderia rhizosphaerae]|uniref:Precorrin-6A reductase n=1 Tax=Paraburkholderia rhizosphaerae TaxID=480658 RepID=A0A4R8LTJ9_9BURK|nr:cobalt-precorrin-6A reductase [Paraburkholderia rhizosphaerae]TDY50838.1 precorrin-6A reductase [Paraburkholderia rhizosphaerae]